MRSFDNDTTKMNIVKEWTTKIQERNEEKKGQRI